VPDFALKIASARWEGEKAVVEGTWKGDVSSVHCDLLEGGESGRPTDRWDRAVGAEISFSERTFRQEFVEDEGRVAENPVDPANSYWVLTFRTYKWLHSELFVAACNPFL
jgi:hypothetical protein